MAEQKTHNNYTVADIERYLQGKMNAREMHDIESAALQDPFLYDAIEGYKISSFTKSYEHLNQIAASLVSERAPAKVITMPSGNRNWWKIAAAIVVVAATGIVSWLAMDNKKKVEPIASVQTAPANKAADSNLAAATKMPPATIEVPKQSFARTEKPGIAKKDGESRNKIATNNIKLADADGRTDVFDSTAVDIKDYAAPPAVVAAAPQNVARPDSLLALKAPAGKNVTADAFFKTAPAQQQAKTNDKGLVIALNPSPTYDTGTITYLNNKTVSRRMVIDSLLAPEGGWETFREYVARKLHKAVDTTDGPAYGDVEVEFTIDETGIARNLKITRSLDKQSDAKALDLVSHWPGWVTSKKHKKGKVVIQF